MSENKTVYTLCKSERLFLQKRIDNLFAKGDSFIAYPLRIIYCVGDGEDKDFPTAILVSVSKRKFKRAVKRNRVKRLIREAYRLNKPEFAEIAGQLGKPIDIAFLYLKNELPDYAEIEKAILKAASILKEKTTPKIADENNP